MEAKVLSEAKVYVGTYAKYNNGSLSGAWLDLSDYSDKEEFYEACRELHKDEEDAEYMFQDWENVPEGLIGESWISENFFALRDAVEDLSDTEQEAFFVWCNYKSHDLGEEDAAYKEIRDARPNQEVVRRALQGWIENCKFGNCVPQKGYIRSLGLKVE
mgnify:FL=1